MARIRVDDELRIRDVLTKRERIDCRHHNVVVAVHDERRLADGPELVIPLSARLAPFADGCGLRLHGCGRRGWVSVLALMAALPECLAGRLACRGRREGEVEKIFERRYATRRNLRDARIVRQLAIAGRGSDEDKAPHEF